MNNLKKTLIIGCIITILLGVLLHFAYDLFNENKLVGIFAPVNESTWEHLKLLFIPFSLFSIFFYFKYKDVYSNIFLLTLISNILGMLSIVMLYYFSSNVLKINNLVSNISVYILGVVISFFVFYIGLTNKKFYDATSGLDMLGICALSLLFTLFILNTYFPFKNTLTKDPNTKTYGIYDKNTS